jgi:hypothetical protein
MESFSRWLAENHPVKCGAAPNGILVAIQRAGPGGITRKELGNLFDMDGRLMNRLLTAYASSGQIAVSREDGKIVFRAVW